MPPFNTQSAEVLPYTNLECRSQSLISPPVTSVAGNAEAKHSIDSPLDDSDPGLRACPMSESHFEVDNSGSRYSHVTPTPSSLEPLSETSEVFTWAPQARSVVLSDHNRIFENFQEHLWTPPSFLALEQPQEDLIADVVIGTTRLLVTKTHCLYTENILGYRSCLLGFQTVFHPRRPHARIKHSEISLSLFPGPKDPGGPNPIIKAIHPSQGVVHMTGEPTTVHHGRDTSFGLSLGVNAHGKVDLTHTRYQSRITNLSGSILCSGIETNTLLLTLKEDREARDGVLSKTQAFEACLTVKSRRGGDFTIDPRNWGPRSKTWTFQYDGMAELGRPTLQHYPDGSRNLVSVSDIESRALPEMGLIV
ncbi:uncharacterized protein MELLADRAFT_107510 [Melampsora larici-populina 98AG31]|uniref:Uncharacterized protein n=1 Tax=Melampsora larici-populina (strain 98AG31 / pathotype 3-4-7) TaxID=747676 RepID=F4RQH6_MELLP|nr:uncharacterized protein MELLADRAFT_107510 [Melampsora larici-populina 98AG31]EGG05298.1 hypothetical protein MELLADRAFT_107510 [Melampsora larici-populina 98AG31]